VLVVALSSGDPFSLNFWLDREGLRALLPAPTGSGAGAGWEQGAVDYLFMTYSGE